IWITFKKVSDVAHGGVLRLIKENGSIIKSIELAPLPLFSPLSDWPALKRHQKRHEVLDLVRAVGRAARVTAEKDVVERCRAIVVKKWAAMREAAETGRIELPVSLQVVE